MPVADATSPDDRSSMLTAPSLISSVRSVSAMLPEPSRGSFSSAPRTMFQLAVPSSSTFRRTIGRSMSIDRTTSGAPRRRFPHTLPSSSTSRNRRTLASVSPSNRPAPAMARSLSANETFGKLRSTPIPTPLHVTCASTLRSIPVRTRSAMAPRKNTGTSVRRSSSPRTDEPAMMTSLRRRVMRRSGRGGLRGGSARGRALPEADDPVGRAVSSGI